MMGARREPNGWARRRFGKISRVEAAQLLTRFARLIAGPWPEARKPARDERLIVTLTTVPERARWIRPAVASLLDQSEPPDAIRIAWPRVTADGRLYQEPPMFPAPVIVDRTTDLGPATKLIAAASAEPRALLVVADDDVLYPPDHLATLLAAWRRAPDGAVGYRGWRVGDGVPKTWPQFLATEVDTPTDVDVLFGTWGWLVRPEWLSPDALDPSRWPPAARWVDDVAFSGFLGRNGISRRVVPARCPPLEAPASWIRALTETVNADGANDLAAIAAFDDAWMARQPARV